MVRRIARFNTYLLAAVCALGFIGCESTSKKGKNVATMRVHLEVTSDDVLKKTTTAKIARSHPIQLTIDQEAFLDESQIVDAGVIDAIGGYAMFVAFDRRGGMLLEQYTAVNPGKHLAITAEWGDKENGQKRWLAAPLIKRRISDGKLSFTPDATREEAEEIVRGLNEHAKTNSEYEKKKKE